MHKRVARQLSQEENLQTVAWGSIHDEFIRLVTSFSGLITKCYADPNLKLEFEISDVHAYFDAIAKKEARS